MIRQALDAEEHAGVGILAYSAKYASAFYGPFREAVELLAGGRPPDLPAGPAPTRAEGVREALLDVEEGADIVMVKPALGYLDVISAVRAAVDIPVAAYNISGEYSMVEAAAAHGWIDRDAAMLEIAHLDPPRRRRHRSSPTGRSTPRGCSACAAEPRRPAARIG